MSLLEPSKSFKKAVSIALISIGTLGSISSLFLTLTSEGSKFYGGGGMLLTFVGLCGLASLRREENPTSAEQPQNPPGNDLS